MKVPKPLRLDASRQGDRAYCGSVRGVVYFTSENYVHLVWNDRHGEDIIRRTSPLWAHIRLEKR